MQRSFYSLAWRLASPVVVVGVSLVISSCGKSAADRQLQTQVEQRLAADPNLQNQKISVSVSRGVVTLSGHVNSDQAREAAAADAQVAGVSTLNNSLTTSLADLSTSSAPASAASSAPPAAAAPPPPQPLQISSGVSLPVSLDDSLGSDKSTAGQAFRGTISEDVLVNGQVAIPRGARVRGTVVNADSAGHFEGQSRLVLNLKSVDVAGQSYDVSTKDWSQLTGSRGKRSGETIGGGAGIGALVGAIAGHGKGAAIGAAVGAGAGTAAEAVTKPPEVELPTETVVRFHLSAPLSVTPPPGT